MATILKFNFLRRVTISTGRLWMGRAWQIRISEYWDCERCEEPPLRCPGSIDSLLELAFRSVRLLGSSPASGGRTGNLVKSKGLCGASSISMLSESRARDIEDSFGVKELTTGVAWPRDLPRRELRGRSYSARSALSSFMGGGEARPRIGTYCDEWEPESLMSSSARAILESRPCIESPSMSPSVMRAGRPVASEVGLEPSRYMVLCGGNGVRLREPEDKCAGTTDMCIEASRRWHEDGCHDVWKIRTLCFRCDGHGGAPSCVR
ncbi:hypothetical protein EDD17DRAFT_768449 [Pisolithus thermaeus]|nr:hypothetical protein EDD17DRAFT_768449 [Pisolithus thermaeus]